MCNLKLVIPFVFHITLDALKESQQDYAKLKEEKESIQNELTNLKSEIEGIKTAAAISENSKQDEINAMQRQCQEEIASLQIIMKGTVHLYNVLSKPLISICLMQN